jgi:hypothetical protein
MKTCYKCHRQITTGKRISMEGIKYECVTEQDIKICQQIIGETEKKAFDAEQKILSSIEGINKCKQCNLYFTDFILLESMPPKYECPFCYSKKYN